MKRISFLLIFGLLFACAPNDQSKKASNAHRFLHDPLLASLQPSTDLFEIDPSKDTLLILNDRGTKVHIPANCFQDRSGKIVTNRVELSFKEFTNSAEIAFSGINMQYTDGKETFNFNSSGMFEIRGQAKGQDVSIRKDKALQLDYALTQNVPNTDFYQLNEKNSNWKLVQKIPTLKESLAPINVNEIDESSILDITFEDQESCPDFLKYKDVRFKIVEDQLVEQSEFNKLYYQVALEKTDEFGVYLLKLGGYNEDANYFIDTYRVNPVLEGEDFEEASKNFEAIYAQAEAAAQAYLAEIEAKEKAEAKRIEEENAAYEKQRLFEQKLNEELIRQQNIQNQQNINQSNVFTAQPVSMDNTYPSIVRGLQVASFGIYNCDQLYRYKQRTALAAVYLDKQGKPIENGYILSVIDLKMKGAFSFDPRNIIVDKASDFVLALFTKDQRLYVLKSKESTPLVPNEDGTTTLRMTEMTSKIENSDDLKDYLGI